MMDGYSCHFINVLAETGKDRVGYQLGMGAGDDNDSESEREV